MSRLQGLLTHSEKQEDEEKKKSKQIKRVLDASTVITRTRSGTTDVGLSGSSGTQPEFVLSGTRHGEYTYPEDNGIYDGHWFNGVRQGQVRKRIFQSGQPIFSHEVCLTFFQGRFLFKAGAYSGSWKNNEYFGEGKLHYITGEVYTGQFLDGLQRMFSQKCGNIY